MMLSTRNADVTLSIYLVYICGCIEYWEISFRKEFWISCGFVSFPLTEMYKVF